MRVRNLNVGLEAITLWRIADETHLPDESSLKPQFLPLQQHLDEILHRPSLDERLPTLLQPDFLDPDLLEPRVLSETRDETRDLFVVAARRRSGRLRRIFELAAEHLDEHRELDDEIRRSLAVLLRG